MAKHDTSRYYAFFALFALFAFIPSDEPYRWLWLLSLSWLSVLFRKPVADSPQQEA